MLLLCLMSQMWTLESVYDSIFSLSYICDVAPVAFQTIYEIVTLTSAICDCIVGFVIVQISDFSWLRDFPQYLQVFGLLHPLMKVVVDWTILALTSMSLREGGFL